MAALEIGDWATSTGIVGEIRDQVETSMGKEFSDDADDEVAKYFTGLATAIFNILSANSGKTGANVAITVTDVQAGGDTAPGSIDS